MNKVLEEIGKGLITLGNIVAALVFLKAYLESAAWLSLAAGGLTLVVTYAVGSRLILKSARYSS